MTRRELLDLLAVERHAPGPRPPQPTLMRQRPVTEAAPVAPEEVAKNRAWLEDLASEMWGRRDATVIDFNERRAS